MDTTAVWDRFDGIGGKCSSHISALLFILSNALSVVTCFDPPMAVSRLLTTAKLPCQESKTYQRQRERILRENTIENTLALLKRHFRTEEVSALTPALQNINDLERLQQLLVICHN